MFEHDIEVITNNILRNIDINKAYIYIDELCGLDAIEPAYKTYFSSEADWWIYEEQLQRLSCPNFDFSDNQLREGYENLDAMLRSDAIIDYDKLKHLVESAVKVRLNMLIRPRTCLKWFVYRGEPTKSCSEILRRLIYFEDYKYLLDGFVEWADHKSIDLTSDYLLSVLEFEKVIEKIDNDALFDLSLDEFSGMLDSLFRFFNPGALLNENNLKCPVSALIIYHDDKGILPVAQALENEYLQKNISSISHREFVEFMHNLVEESEANSIDVEEENDTVELAEIILASHSDEMTEFDNNEEITEFDLPHDLTEAEDDHDMVDFIDFTEENQTIYSPDELETIVTFQGETRDILKKDEIDDVDTISEVIDIEIDDAYFVDNISTPTDVFVEDNDKIIEDNGSAILKDSSEFDIDEEIKYLDLDVTVADIETGSFPISDPLLDDDIELTMEEELSELLGEDEFPDDESEMNDDFSFNKSELVQDMIQNKEITGFDEQMVLDSTLEELMLTESDDLEDLSLNDTAGIELTGEESEDEMSAPDTSDVVLPSWEEIDQMLDTHINNFNKREKFDSELTIDIPDIDVNLESTSP
ncbi:MAG: hypothetical protein HW421_3497 [Ignavibacteria bacterium]|nr:hypothetical protein [Ignavibacteria bacterium]